MLDKNYKDKIDSIFNDSSLDVKSKKRLFTIVNAYNNVKILDDYKKIEDKLYISQGVLSDEEKVAFEIQRISRFIIKNKKLEANSRLLSIVKSFELYKNSDNKEMITYIINSIIALELDLGMIIALYSELHDYCESEIDNYYYLSLNNIDDTKGNAKRIRGNDYDGN